MKVRLGNYIQEYSVRNRKNEDIPVYSVTNTEGFCTDYFYKEVASKNRSTYKIVPKGFFAYNPSRINVGSVDWQRYEDRVIVSPLYVVFSASENILPQYLFYFLKSSFALTYIHASTIGSVRNNLKFSMLENFPFELRSIEKQKHIVQILDNIKQQCKLYQIQIAKLDTLIKARFVEMFGDNITNPMGWKQRKIGDCCTLKSGVSLPVEVENEGGPIPYLKVGDMNYPGNERYIRTSSRFVDTTTAGKGIFEVGSILFPKRGGAISTNKKRMTKLPVCADLNIMGVSSNGSLLPEYLLVYFDMIDLAKLSDGSSVPQINNKNIAPLFICLPPLELQQQFSAFVTQVDKSKVAVQKALEEAQLLFDSLMQEYFGG